MTNSDAAADLVLEIVRIFDAPRELVFKAWTEPERLMQWWGPVGMTVPYFEADVRPGGTWRSVLQQTDGPEYPHHGTFIEIVPPERLSTTFKWVEEGKPGVEMIIQVSFVEQGGKTEMTFRQAAFGSVEQRNGENEGWNECFDFLAAYLTSATA